MSSSNCIIGSGPSLGPDEVDGGVGVVCVDSLFGLSGLFSLLTFFTDDRIAKIAINWNNWSIKIWGVAVKLGLEQVTGVGLWWLLVVLWLLTWQLR